MRALLAWLLLCVTLPVRALAVGEVLPPLRIEAPGELQLVDGELRQQPWQSDARSDRVQVLQYVAGRLSARALNEPFLHRLETSGLAYDRYHLTTIVNLDDAMPGSRPFVMAELGRKKQRYFLSSVVADGTGSGRLAWGLQAGSSAIIILGPDGRIRFVHDGALDAADIEAALALLAGTR